LVLTSSLSSAGRSPSAAGRLPSRLLLRPSICAAQADPSHGGSRPELAGSNPEHAGLSRRPVSTCLPVRSHYRCDPNAEIAAKLLPWQEEAGAPGGHRRASAGSTGRNAPGRPGPTHLQPRQRAQPVRQAGELVAAEVQLAQLLPRGHALAQLSHLRGANAAGRFPHGRPCATRWRRDLARPPRHLPRSAN
jgi:hypothetical protein